MGTWGPENFANDGACDYRDSLSQGLIETIEKCFNDEDASSLDGGGEAELMPSVAMLVVLCEHCGAHPPKVKVVQEWRNRYLQIYDDQIDGLRPDPDYKIERREIIDQTFQGLQEQAQIFWRHQTDE